MALPQKHRLITKPDFDRAFKNGKAVKGSFLFIKSRANELNFPRFGLVVPKKVYPRAVDRNRLKRVLSEIATTYLKNNLTSGRDFVVVINRKGKEDLINNEFTNLLKVFRGQ